MEKIYKLFGLITLWKVQTSMRDEDALYDRLEARFNAGLREEIKRQRRGGV